MTAGGLSLTINGPAQKEYAEDPSNNSSLIVTLACGGAEVLFTGDAKDARLSEFLAGYERGEGDLILKMPYHGHWLETLPDLVQAAAPAAAVLTCSKSEPDKDERALTEALLESAGVPIYRTFEGDITVTLDGSGYTITQE